MVPIFTRSSDLAPCKDQRDKDREGGRKVDSEKTSYDEEKFRERLFGSVNRCRIF